MLEYNKMKDKLNNAILQTYAKYGDGQTIAGIEKYRDTCDARYITSQGNARIGLATVDPTLIDKMTDYDIRNYVNNLVSPRRQFLYDLSMDAAKINENQLGTVLATAYNGNDSYMTQKQTEEYEKIGEEGIRQAIHEVLEFNGIVCPQEQELYRYCEFFINKLEYINEHERENSQPAL